MFLHIVIAQADAAVTTGIDFIFGFERFAFLELKREFNDGDLLAETKGNYLPLSSVVKIRGGMQFEFLDAGSNLDNKRFKKTGANHTVATAGMIALGRNGCDASRFVHRFAEIKNNVAIGRGAFYAGDAMNANAPGRFELQLVDQRRMERGDRAGRIEQERKWTFVV